MPGGPGKVELQLLPEGRTGLVEVDATFLDALRSLGADVPSGCGGQGRCGMCRIRISGDPPPPTASEEARLSAADLADGWRLACRQKVERATSVTLPAASNVTQDKVRTPPTEYDTSHCGVRKRVALLPEEAGDRSLTGRLKTALGCGLEVPFSVLSSNAGVFEADRPVTVFTVGRRVVALERGESAAAPLGLAVDVGTSTVAVYLLDLSSGEELGARAAPNAQARFGADVVSRIAHAQQGGAEGSRELREAVQRTVNTLIGELLATADASAVHVARIAVVGNPTMLHLFAGVNPESLGRTPFAPLWRGWRSVRAEDLGLDVNLEAETVLVPMVSGYVGADVVAGIVACELQFADEPVLYLDLGTNGELVLATPGGLVACSAAAGPAFEAVGISCGMTALEGAISHVEIDGGVRWTTIGGEEARGVCGTGLTDAVSELLRAGVVDRQGKMHVPEGALAERVEGEGRERRFVLCTGERPIFISQGDIRMLQLAKAALRSGVEYLLAEMELEPEQVKSVYLAGAFGAQMRPESLIRVGLLPEAFHGRVKAAGNAAGQGAKAVLTDVRLAREVRRVARGVRYVELASQSEFSRRYVQEMRFPGGEREVRE